MSASRLRVLMLSNKMPYPPKDGGAIATLNTALGLADLGHAVTMLVMNTSKHYFRLENVPDQVRQKIEIIPVDVNTDISVLRALRNFLISSVPYNAERFITPAYDQKLGELLSQRHFDVIHLEGAYLGPYIRTIRRHTTSLISMRPPNVEHEIWQRVSVMTPWPKRAYLHSLAKRIKRFETSMINNYDVLIPITARDAAIYRRLGCKLPIHVSPTGIDPNELIPATNGEDLNSIFHIGALDWAPNIDGVRWFLTHAWPRIHREFPHLKFYLAGRNATFSFSNIALPNVVFLGEVDNAFEFMRSKGIMVVPLFSASGLRIKIIEGMALGKAIISTTVGVEGIDCSHKENIMVADTVDEMVQALHYLLGDPTRIQAMGQNAMQFARENYDNLKVADALARFYLTHLP